MSNICSLELNPYMRFVDELPTLTMLKLEVRDARVQTRTHTRTRIHIRSSCFYVYRLCYHAVRSVELM
jgi:hypothetical protein